MSWILPLPLLSAGVVLLSMPFLLPRQTSSLRLVAETFATTVLVTVMVWLRWAVLWLIEQRW